MTTVNHNGNDTTDYPSSDPIARAIANCLDAAVADHPGTYSEWLAANVASMATAVRAELTQGEATRRSILDALCRMANDDLERRLQPTERERQQEQGL